MAYNLMMLAIVAVCLAAIHTGFDERQRRLREATRCELDCFEDEGVARFKETWLMVLEFRLVAPVTRVFISPFGAGAC